MNTWPDLYKPQRICFFFQAEDGIRDGTVTVVQTCAVPIPAGPACTLPTSSLQSCSSTSSSRTTPPAPSRASRPEAVRQPPNTPDLLLAGGDVLLHDGAWRVERADVTVRGGRIEAVGRTDGRADRKTTPVSVRDCSGCLIIPGLIQAHVHLCQTLFRGLADDLRLEDWLVRRIWPLEAAHTEETVYWSALLGAAELLLGGTTAILDMETVRHTGAAFQALERIGIRAAVGKCLMDAHPEGAPLELAESTDNALAEAESLAKRWHNGGDGGGRLRVCVAPRFVPSCPGPLLRDARP